MLVPYNDYRFCERRLRAGKSKCGQGRLTERGRLGKVDLFKVTCFVKSK